MLIKNPFCGSFRNDNKYLFLIAYAIYLSGKPTEAVKVLEKLTHNAVAERRFDDASYYFWKLSMAYLKLANQSQSRGWFGFCILYLI